MSEKLEIYKCEICGNLIQVLVPGAGELVCCGEPMEKVEAQYNETEIGEKHVPVIETAHAGCDTGVCHEVKFVQLNQHPMTPEHYIQFIEVCSKDKKEVRIKFFEPDEKPIYDITDMDEVKAFENCNIHGFWRSKCNGHEEKKHD